MRNLKKVLSLALAMVMLLGMMVVGAGAATSFKDDSSIPENRAVAVAVANALEVLLGDENGNFNPDNTLTRAEAAVVLAKLDLGADAAKALTATNAATFDDVGTGYGWAKAYIDYCAGNGYMVGVGGNKFAPGRTLTSVEFATMVSRVLGYKDENEYGKDGWTAVKAAALARKAGLGADVAIANADMSRADMAQMVLNALTAPMVEYTGLNGSIGDATFSSPATTRKHANDQGYGASDYKGDAIVPSITPIRLCEERFPYLKLSATEEDNFGHTAAVWKYRNAEIINSETTVPADITINGFVNSTVDDWARIKGLRYGNGSTLFINGVEYGLGGFPVDENGSRTMAAFASTLTGNGRQVEIYLNERDLTLIDKVVVIDTALAEVTKVVDSEETISVKLAKSAVTEGNVVLNTKHGFGEFKKGDLVLVQGYGSVKLNKDTTIDNVTAPTVVEGFATVKKYNSDLKATYITVEGENRYDAKAVMDGYAVGDFDLNTEFDSTLYLDQYGYIMKAIEGKDPNAVYDKLIAVSEAYQTLTDGKIVNMIKGVLSNGESVTWSTGKNNYSGFENKIALWEKSGSTYTLNKIERNDLEITDNDQKTNDRQLYRYYPDSTVGTINFKSNDVFGKLENNGSRIMYSDTVRFIFVDAEEGVVVVNGRQSYDFVTKAGSILAQAVNSDNEITAVFVSDKSGVANINDIIFVSSRNKESDRIITRDDGSRVQYYGYTAYNAKGEAIEEFLGVNSEMANQFFIADKNADGAYKDTTRLLLETHTMVSGILTEANGTSGDAFTLTDTKDSKPYEFVGRSSTVVKDLTDAKLYIESISELNAAYNNGYALTIAVIYNDTDALASTNNGEKVKEAKTVFVTNAVKGGTVIPGGDKPSGGVGGASTTINYDEAVYNSGKYLEECLASYDSVLVDNAGDTTYAGTVRIPTGKTLAFTGNVTGNSISFAKGSTLLVDGTYTTNSSVPAGATVRAGNMMTTAATSILGNVTVDDTLTVKGDTGSVTTTISGTVKTGKIKASAASAVVNVTGTLTVGNKTVETGETVGGDLTINVLSTSSLHITGNVNKDATIVAGNGNVKYNGYVTINGVMNGTFEDQNVKSATVSTPVQEIKVISEDAKVTMSKDAKLTTEDFGTNKVDLKAGATITLEKGTDNCEIGVTDSNGATVDTGATETTIVVGANTGDKTTDGATDIVADTEDVTSEAPITAEATIVYNEATWNAAIAAGFKPIANAGATTTWDSNWDDKEHGITTMPWLLVKVTAVDDVAAETLVPTRVLKDGVEIKQFKSGTACTPVTLDTNSAVLTKGATTTFHWEMTKSTATDIFSLGNDKFDLGGSYTVEFNWKVNGAVPASQTAVVTKAVKYTDPVVASAATGFTQNLTITQPKGDNNGKVVVNSMIDLTDEAASKIVIADKKLVAEKDGWFTTGGDYVGAVVIEITNPEGQYGDIQVTTSNRNGVYVADSFDDDGKTYFIMGYKNGLEGTRYFAIQLLANAEQDDVVSDAGKVTTMRWDMDWSNITEVPTWPSAE